MTAPSGTQSTLAALSQAHSFSAGDPQQGTLWRQLVKRLPDWSNATRYYAHDVQRFGMSMFSEISADGDDMERGPAEEHEVHYVPTPATPVAFDVHSVALGTLPCGTTVLTLCIDRGIALFEVTAAGVFELAVDMNVPGGPALAVRMPTIHEAVVLTKSAVMWYHLRQRQFSAPRELSFPAVDLFLMDRHAVVRSGEFSQLFVLALPGFEEERTIFSDGGVVAASPCWLAYSGMGETPTSFSAKKAETALEQVTKNVVSGLQVLRGGLWGHSPQMTPTPVPLGTVVVHDADTGHDVASFCAHAHALQCMQFDRTGTLLATASTAGTTINVWQVSSLPGRHAGARPVGQVALLYRLTRGMTSCVVTDVQFGPHAAWVAVCTAIGTCHLYHLDADARASLGQSAVHRAAPAYGAVCRARGAPSAVAPNPRFAFFPHVVMTGGKLSHADAVVASASGMVSVLRVGTAGATVSFTKYLDGFCGPRSAEFAAPAAGSSGGPGSAAASASAATAADAAAAVALSADLQEEQRMLDGVWRAFVELETHPRQPDLVGFKLVPLAATQPQQRAAAVPMAAASAYPYNPQQQQQQHQNMQRHQQPQMYGPPGAQQFPPPQQQQQQQQQGRGYYADPAATLAWQADQQQQQYSRGNYQHPCHPNGSQPSSFSSDPRQPPVACAPGSDAFTSWFNEEPRMSQPATECGGLTGRSPPPGRAAMPLAPPPPMAEADDWMS